MTNDMGKSNGFAPDGESWWDMESQVLFGLARYLDVTARKFADEEKAEIAEDLGHYAGATRDIASMIRITRQTLRDATEKMKQELAAGTVSPYGFVPEKPREFGLTLLQGIKSIPDIDGGTVQVIPVYEPDAIPPEILANGVPGAHITGYGHGKSRDTEQVRYVRRVMGETATKAPLYSVWDLVEDKVVENPEKYPDAMPDETHLEGLSERDVQWWLAKLNRAEQERARVFPRYVLNDPEDGTGLVSVWDMTKDQVATSPDGGLLFELHEDVANTWLNRLNANAGHDTPTGQAGDAH